MGWTMGLIAIKGQHLNNLATIFRSFQLVDTGQDVILNNWTAADALMLEENFNTADRDEYVERRVVWYRNGWTIIEDLSLVLCTNEEAFEKISRQLNTPVFAMLEQSTSGSYAFWYFDQQKIRSYFYSDGDVSENYGEPLPQEAGANDEVLLIAKAFGIDWRDAEHHDHFIVKILEPDANYRAELEAIGQQQQQELAARQAAKKPWWKFW
jgi:hypothetical protein